MTVRARCLLCSKIIVSPDNDTLVFLDHIRIAHSEILILDSNTEMQEQNSQKSPTPNEQEPYESKKRLSEGGVTEKPVPNEQASRPIYSHRPVYVQKPQRKKMYKTSIQKWRPGKRTVYCPKCGCANRPNIRSHSEKVSSSTFGAAVLLSCWPFCFLPWGFHTPTKEYLHCPVCNNFLGLYDRQSEMIRPNREFVDSYNTPRNPEMHSQRPNRCSRNAYRRHYDFNISEIDKNRSMQERDTKDEDMKDKVVDDKKEKMNNKSDMDDKTNTKDKKETKETKETKESPTKENKEANQNKDSQPKVVEKKRSILDSSSSSSDLAQVRKV